MTYHARKEFAKILYTTTLVGAFLWIKAQTKNGLVSSVYQVLENAAWLHKFPDQVSF